MKCPQCKEGEIVQRFSRRGAFYSCNRYPKCEFSLSKKPVNRPCPQCKAPFLLEHETKREGKIELCNNPECGYREKIKDDDAKVSGLERRREAPLAVLLSLFLHHRKARLVPGIHSAEKSRCVGDAVLIQDEHRPGARMFSRSRTVRG